MKRFYLMILSFAMAFGSQAQLLTESFETSVPPAGWQRFNAGTGNNWGRTTNTQLANLGFTAQDGTSCAFYQFNSANNANTWLITSGVALTAGVTYNTSFFYTTLYDVDPSGFFPEKLKVTVGTAATVAAQTTVIWDNNGGTELTNSSWQKGNALFTPTTTGTYYFGFNCYSDADNFILLLDNVNIGPAAANPPTCAANILPAAQSVVSPFPSVDFDWQKVNGADSYDFYLSETNPPTDLDLVGEVSEDSVSLEGLEYNKTYYWYVVPKNSAGSATGCVSNVTAFSTGDAPDLAPCVTNISPVNNATNVSRYSPVKLDWTASPGAVYYNIYLGTTNPPALVQENWPQDSAFIPANATLLADNTTYYWYIAPVNGAGESVGCESNVSTFTTGGPPVIPVCATIVAPVAAATNVNPYPGVNFDWTAVSGASDYEIYIFSDNAATDTLFSSTTDGVDSLLLSGLGYATTYYWKVVPVNVLGEGATTCGIQSFTTIAYPAAPVNDNCAGAIAITNSTIIVGNTIGATQSLPASTCGGQAGNANDDVWYSFVATGSDTATIVMQGIGNFDGVVEVFSGSCGSLTPIACADSTVEGEVEYFRLTGLTAGATYYFRVYNWYGGTGTTGEFLVQVSGAGVVLPVTFTKFTGERKQEVNVLHWETATETNNSGFELQRSVDGINFSSIGFVKSKSLTGGSTGVNQYEFTDNKPFAGNNYYRLNQLDRDGRSTYSQIVRLLGVTNRLELVTVYPNPTKGQLNMAVVSPKANKITVTVSDITGKVVLSRTMAVASGDNNLQLDVQNLSAGSYMIKASCADGCETSVKKFIKR